MTKIYQTTLKYGARVWTTKPLPKDLYRVREVKVAGILHREDGPALEGSIHRNWWLYGVKVWKKDVLDTPEKEFWWNLKS